MSWGDDGLAPPGTPSWAWDDRTDGGPDWSRVPERDWPECEVCGAPVPALSDLVLCNRCKETDDG